MDKLYDVWSGFLIGLAAGLGVSLLIIILTK
jgi:hypothetical protein